MAIGARSQSARTYLEKNLDTFPDCNQDELIKHCMRALRDTLPNEVELTVKVPNFNSNLTIEYDFFARIVPWLLLVKIHHLPS